VGEVGFEQKLLLAFVEFGQSGSIF
jgi:hypothetical protein